MKLYYVCLSAVVLMIVSTEPVLLREDPSSRFRAPLLGQTPVKSTNASTTAAPPQPPIPPHPVQQNWVVRADVTNISCIVVSMTVAAIIPYQTTEDEWKNASVNIPPTAAATGSCGVDEQVLRLSWNYNEAGAVSPNNTLIFTFSRKQKTYAGVKKDKYAISRVDLQVYFNPVNFPGALNASRVDARAANVTYFEGSMGKSHVCQPEKRIPLKVENHANNTAYLILSNVHLEAFRTRIDEGFDEAEDCEPQGMVTSDVLPIVIGSALGAVVLASIVAYLIGRRRKRQTAYTTM